MRRTLPAIFFSLIIFAFSVTAPNALAKSPGVKHVKVGVAVAPSFKAVPDWKSKFKKRLAYASQIFEREAGLKFKLHKFMDWNPRTEGSTKAMLEDLRNTFPLGAVDIVIGLGRLTEMPDLDRINDLHVIGRARPFSGYILIRYPNDPLFKIQEETVLVHELGHLYGAIHTDDNDSIMAPYVDKHIPTHFDMENKEILKLTRDINFRTGVNALDHLTNQRLINSYMNLIKNDQTLDFYYMMGIFYLNLGKMEEAKNAWARAAEDPEAPPQVHYDLGQLYIRLGDTQQAIRVFTTASRDFDMPWQRDLRAKALNGLGESYLKADNLIGAFNAFSRGSAADPENLDIQINLAFVQLKRGQAERAIRDLNFLLEKDPNNIKVLHYLGLAYSDTGQGREALQYLNRAIQVIGKTGSTQKYSYSLSEIYKHLGDVYFSLRDADRAISSYRASCRYFETLECHKNLGQAYFRANQWDAAVTELAGVIQRDPDDTNTYGLLGVAFSQTGRDDQAIAIFREGLTHAKDKRAKSMLHNNIGHIYMQKQHADFAQKEFRMAVSNDWQNVDAHIGLATANIRKNNFRGAQTSLKTALSIDPDHAKARQLLQDVEELIANTPTPTVRISARGTVNRT